MNGLKIAVIGATGAVGRTMVKILEERDFPVSELKLFASERSAGAVLHFKDTLLRVEPIRPNSFENCDIALFSVPSRVSRTTAPLAVESGCFVIDNSSAWRMEKNVPLVVPEVNPQAIGESKLIANPNCSTIQLVVALYPIHKTVGLERIVVSTYQAVSGTGKDAIDELSFQTKRKLFTPELETEPEIYPHQIAFNCIPHIDEFVDEGYTKEEMKMVNESRKIMNLPALAISATCVRVPVYNGHAESVTIDTRREISIAEVREIFSNAPGVKLIDNTQDNLYPMQITADGKDEVLVGRIRKNLHIAKSMDMWIVADNLRKGAATNAVQIAELVVEKHFN